MRAALRIPLHVLIRPRAGDFLYDAQELLVSSVILQALTHGHMRAAALLPVFPVLCTPHVPHMMLQITQV